MANRFSIRVKTKKHYDRVVKKLKKLGYACSFYKEKNNDAWETHKSKTVILCDDDKHTLYCDEEYYFEKRKGVLKEIQYIGNYFGPPFGYYGKKIISSTEFLK